VCSNGISPALLIASFSKALVFAGKIGTHETDYEDFQSIVKATAGIVFLGTPHRGSNFAEWGL